VCRCVEVYTGVYRCVEVYTGVHVCVGVLLDRQPGTAGQ
jgi:hypothetical protein